MILPVQTSCFREATHIGTETYHNLKEITTEKYRKDVGDAGRVAPDVLENKGAFLEPLKTFMVKVSYTAQVFCIIMDMAASEFCRSPK